MIVLNLYMLDTQIHVEFAFCCQQPIPPLTTGYFPSIPPRMESQIQLLSLQPLLKPPLLLDISSKMCYM